MTDRPWDLPGTGALDPFRAKLRRATNMVLAVLRRLGEEGDELRAGVLADFKEALTGTGPTLEWIEVDGDPGPQLCITTDGIFRAAFEEFGLDRSDPYVQENAWELVRRELDGLSARDERWRSD